MKIEGNQLSYITSDNKSSFHYKVHFVYSGEDKNIQLKKFQEQWKAGIFKADMGQIFTDRKIYPKQSNNDYDLLVLVEYLLLIFTISRH